MAFSTNGIIFAYIPKILMNMKNIILFNLLFFLAFNAIGQSNTEKIDKDVVKNVILIETNPWEVLMSKNGDVLAKLKHKPNYLKGYDTDWKKNNIVVNENTAIVKVEPPKKEKITLETKEILKFSDTPLKSEIKEVFFKTGSALLRSNEITFLNAIALNLTQNKSMKYKLFGFNSEPDYRFHILAKRRMDAVMAYLKVKGVDLNNQIVIGSSVNGENNKIVFAEMK